MIDDSKNASSWEVVGGKGGSGGKKSKTDQKKKDGTSKNGGSQPVKVVKVDELGTFNLLYDNNFFSRNDTCILPIFYSYSIRYQICFAGNYNLCFKFAKD